MFKSLKLSFQLPAAECNPFWFRGENKLSAGPSELPRSFPVAGRLNSAWYPTWLIGDRYIHTKWNNPLPWNILISKIFFIMKKRQSPARASNEQEEGSQETFQSGKQSMKLLHGFLLPCPVYTLICIILARDSLRPSATLGGPGTVRGFSFFAKKKEAQRFSLTGLQAQFPWPPWKLHEQPDVSQGTDKAVVLIPHHRERMPTSNGQMQICTDVWIRK